MKAAKLEGRGPAHEILTRAGWSLAEGDVAEYQYEKPMGPGFGILTQADVDGAFFAAPDRVWGARVMLTLLDADFETLVTVVFPSLHEALGAIGGAR